ncbi:hypothetical protein BDZ45DRAFT_580058 [Acephala macrosclerotiorum]|nr:hypothetical protein BDZ45DRAFT_580058 [Acephala macrosclerotiorum]
MLDFPAETKNAAKCYVTHGVLGHIDPKQPPVKRKPFSVILKQDFIQKVELILPEEIYEIIKHDLMTNLPLASYSRVILPLAALLRGEFFNEYIKKGGITSKPPVKYISFYCNILMLSEGKIGVDNVYSLREGVLILHLDKESYERAGIVGQPEGVKGKRGTKPRWVVEINLRLPSMLHGKNGFDRIDYAFKNVLNVPVTWLFINLETKGLLVALEPETLGVHFPVKKSVAAQTSESIHVKMPTLEPPTEVDASYGANFEDYAVDLLEWLSLLLLESPRILAEDKIDPYLSRYVPPGGPSTSSKLAKVKWRGFISAFWARNALVQVLQATPRDSWFAFSVDGFGNGPLGESKSCTILKLPKAATEYVLWEIA